MFMLSQPTVKELDKQSVKEDIAICTHVIQGNDNDFSSSIVKVIVSYVTSSRGDTQVLWHPTTVLHDRVYQVICSDYGELVLFPRAPKVIDNVL